jgi:hypothetical protein
MGARTSSYATAGIALRVSGALKPHHHDEVETLSVGICKYRHVNYIPTKILKIQNLNDICIISI